MKSTKKIPASLGGWVCAWIEKYLVHSEGDCYGMPFRLIDHHKRFIWKAYELNADGSRRYDRALWGMPKGNAKTEIGAALSLCELAGPVCFAGWKNGRPLAKPRLAPDIPVAAASFEQADNLFGAARTMVKEGPLAPFFDVFDTEIIPKQGPGRLYRVAAAAGTNDGKRPTFFVADELHEWTGGKERVHLVLSNGRAKRTDAWELSISTAGWDLTTLLGRLYLHGKEVQAGDSDDAKFLFDWIEAGEYDFSDEDQVRGAVLESNPGVGHFLNPEAIIQRAKEIPEHEFRRYYTNQWTEAPEVWIPRETWEAAGSFGPQPPAGSRIVVGFDGSYSGDSTGMVGCNLDGPPRLFVIGHWKKPDATKYDWRVDVLDVENAARETCQKWKVAAMGCDPYRWQRSMAVLEEEGLPIVEYGTHLPSKMVPACSQFFEAVSSNPPLFTHDGNADLAEHVRNCVVKIDSRGPRITKDNKDSPRKIDLAVCAVIAYDLRVRNTSRPSVYSRRETAVM